MARLLHFVEAMRSAAAGVVIASTLLTLSVAGAEPAARAEASREDQPVALAVNAPVSWGSATSASVYARLAAHHAVRGNIAVYDYKQGIAYKLVSQDAGAESEYSGRTVDVGIAWQYYPDRVWSGFVLEAGVLRRAEDHTADESRWNNRIERRQATGYAVRALLGWSLLFSNNVFVAAAVGVSVGPYAGTSSVQRTDDVGNPDGMLVTAAIDEPQHVAGEVYLRLGVAFGR